MPRFALASELHRLTPDQIILIDHIIADDGDWTCEQIAHYIAQWHTLEIVPHPDDWTRP
jgi:3-keto-L-gulonate-6-phosphate decarboxylase